MEDLIPSSESCRRLVFLNRTRTVNFFEETSKNKCLPPARAWIHRAVMALRSLETRRTGDGASRRRSNPKLFCRGCCSQKFLSSSLALIQVLNAGIRWLAFYFSSPTHDCDDSGWIAGILIGEGVQVLRTPEWPERRRPPPLFRGDHRPELILLWMDVCTLLYAEDETADCYGWDEVNLAYKTKRRRRRLPRTFALTPSSSTGPGELLLRFLGLSRKRIL